MSETIQTIQTSEPIKRRGRPRTGTAMSGAEKMRALRQRARGALDQGASLADQTDTALLESLAMVYRQGQTDRATAVMGELLRRLLTRAGDQGDQGKERSSASEETDAAGAGGEPVRAKSGPLTLAMVETVPVPVAVTVTGKKGSKPKPFYPPHVKARAVAMRAAGETHRAILGMIRSECEGRAPDESNIGRLLKTWGYVAPVNCQLPTGS